MRTAASAMLAAISFAALSASPAVAEPDRLTLITAAGEVTVEAEPGECAPVDGPLDGAHLVLAAENPSQREAGFFGDEGCEGEPDAVVAAGSEGAVTELVRFVKFAA
ncbi:hypothetical protein [Actinokineospora fastidiosa]|uniref:Uncharacterized protein n=1 Tax=Actinokineospora fastidiosa TaxID=1816 RepID=A0A918LAV9_9PSEU|nr:hypothetical protein [Actinokineospora fastidiosa]GGS25505.1 hypothetical protein GCM10010171_18540 [Actinokineospora fastidiosa]